MLAVSVRLTAYTCRCPCNPKRVSDPHGWVLGSKLGSSASTVCILNCWAIISPNHWPMVLESTVSLGPEGMVEFPATRTCGGDTSHTADLKQKFKTRPEASISFNNLPLFCHQVSPPRGSDAIERTQDTKEQALETLLCGGIPEPIRNGYQMQSCIYGFRAFIFLNYYCSMWNICMMCVCEYRCTCAVAYVWRSEGHAVESLLPLQLVKKGSCFHLHACCMMLAGKMRRLCPVSASHLTLKMLRGSQGLNPEPQAC